MVDLLPFTVYKRMITHFISVVIFSDGTYDIKFSNVAVDGDGSDVVIEGDITDDVIVIMSENILIWDGRMRNDFGKGEHVGLECKREHPLPRRRPFKNGMITQKLSD